MESRTPIPPIWDNLGLVVGTEINNGATISTSEMLADAAYHASIGLRHARIGGIGFVYLGGSYGAERVAFIHSTIETYLSYNISVQYTLNYGDGQHKIDATKEAGYAAYVAQEAAWAEAAGVQRLQVNNEQELYLATGYTHQNCYDFVQSLVAVSRNAGFTGALTYSIVPNNYSAWITNGIGAFDDIGLDSYGTLKDFETQGDLVIQRLGPNTFLSEWQAGQDDYTIDSRYKLADMEKRLVYAKSRFPNHPNYLFTWKYQGGEGEDARGAKTMAGDIRPFWYSMIGQRGLVAF